MNRQIRCAVILLLAIVASPATAQQDAVAVPPPARPEDVASMDAILAALYEVISGPAAEERDWDRFRSLFVPGARLIPTGVDTAGRVRHRVMTPDDYVRTSGPFLTRLGFFEREIHRETERFGNVAHAFSTYETRLPSEGDRLIRGINSIQLLWDGQRWWVVSIFWDNERAGLTIPAEYLD